MFTDLLGNETARSQIQRLIVSGRVPGALLFAGPEAVGKRLFALELARSLVCVDHAETGACGKCAACFRVGEIQVPAAEKGEEYDRVFFSNHADVGMIVPFKRNLRVGSVRALEREANFRPFEASARVFIVNDAEKMNDSAANALLKTLEEPPTTTFIVLISSRPDGLLQTIRSRSQMIRFRRVAADEIERHLIQKHGRNAEDARLAAHACGGSIGRAIAMDLEWLRSTRDEMLNVISGALAGGSMAAMLKTAERLTDARNKDVFEDNLTVLETLISDIWKLSCGGGYDNINNPDLAKTLSAFASDAQPRRFAAWLDEIEKLRQGLNVNINKKIATDALFMKMAA